jgi:hypothetical protein
VACIESYFQSTFFVSDCTNYIRSSVPPNRKNFIVFYDIDVIAVGSIREINVPLENAAAAQDDPVQLRKMPKELVARMLGIFIGRVHRSSIPTRAAGLTSTPQLTPPPSHGRADPPPSSAI